MITMSVVAAYLAYTKWLAVPVRGQYATDDVLHKNVPRITKAVWGTITVAISDGIKEYKDCRLWPQGTQAWDWNKTGMHHKPGIQIADVQDLVDKADIFVLSRGMHLVLQVPQETIDYLKSKNKQVHVLETKQAVEKYNELVAQGKRVAALIHSTC